MILNQIKIKRSLQQSSKGLRLKETKTEDRRIITLARQFMKALHRYYVKKLNLKMANLWKGFEDVNGQVVFLLFSDEYGVPNRADTLTQFWNRFVNRHKDIQSTLNLYSHITEEDEMSLINLCNWSPL